VKEAAAREQQFKQVFSTKLLLLLFDGLKMP